MGAQRAEGIGLLALQIFVTLSAIAGGIALMSGTIELPSEWLTDSFFANYTVPGIILAVAVGGSQLVALASTYSRRDVYLAALAAAGAILMGWIIVEMIIVGTHDVVMFAYQMVYFAIGFLEFALASTEFRQRGTSG